MCQFENKVLKEEQRQPLCEALTFTSAAILSMANPSTVSCEHSGTQRCEHALKM